MHFYKIPYLLPYLFLFGICIFPISYRFPFVAKGNNRGYRRRHMVASVCHDKPFLGNGTLTGMSFKLLALVVSAIGEQKQRRWALLKVKGPFGGPVALLNSF